MSDTSDTQDATVLGKRGRQQGEGAGADQDDTAGVEPAMKKATIQDEDDDDSDSDVGPMPAPAELAVKKKKRKGTGLSVSLTDYLCSGF